MYKKGDILKANMDQAYEQYEGCEGTVVYKTMMERAATWRFEVLEDLGGEYKLKRLHDNQVASKSKAEVHSNLIIAND